MANANPNQSGLKPAWSKENQPKGKNGRKPSSVKKYIKDNNLNYYDVSSMAKFILPLNKDQLTKLLQDDKVPFVMRLFARSVLEDMKKGNLNNIMTLVDRAVGKPKEIQEVTLDMEPPKTRKEVQERIKELSEKYDGS